MSLSALRHPSRQLALPPSGGLDLRVQRRNVFLPLNVDPLEFGSFLRRLVFRANGRLDLSGQRLQVVRDEGLFPLQFDDLLVQPPQPRIAFHAFGVGLVDRCSEALGDLLEVLAFVSGRLAALFQRSDAGVEGVLPPGQIREFAAAGDDAGGPVGRAQPHAAVRFQHFAREGDEAEARGGVLGRVGGVGERADDERPPEQSPHRGGERGFVPYVVDHAGKHLRTGRRVEIVAE